MVIARLLFLLMGVAAIASFIAFALTGQVRYRVCGVRIVTAAVVSGLVFFAGLVVEHFVSRA